jgi:hypothetical protein
VVLTVIVTTVNLLPVCLTDRRRLVTGVMLACWDKEDIRAMLTKSRDKTIEQSITDS